MQAMCTISGDRPNAHIVEVEEDNINIFDVGASMQKIFLHTCYWTIVFILELIYPFI